MKGLETGEKLKKKSYSKYLSIFSIACKLILVIIHLWNIE